MITSESIIQSESEKKMDLMNDSSELEEISLVHERKTVDLNNDSSELEEIPLVPERKIAPNPVEIPI